MADDFRGFPSSSTKMIDDGLDWAMSASYAAHCISSSDN
jgi:hypothetical protein